MRKCQDIKRKLESNLIEDNWKFPIFSKGGVPVRMGVEYDDNGLSVVDKNRPGFVLFSMCALE